MSLGPVEIVVLVLFFVAPGVIVARAAHRRGKTWWLWGLAGLLFSWIGAIVMLLILDKGPTPASPE